MDKFWAHSDPAGRSKDDPESHWQLLSDHLRNVSKLACQLAHSASPSDKTLAQMAATAGILHDFGKYQSCFQNMLNGKKDKCQHAIYGALLVRKIEADSSKNRFVPLAHAIAAHHAGLKDEAKFERISDKHNLSAEVENAFGIVDRISAAANADQPLIKKALDELESIPSPAGNDLFTRILLSCLVDADRLDTAGVKLSQNPLKADLHLIQLKAELDNVRERAFQAGASAVVLDIRTKVQELCAEAATREERLFSLSVPTGGGKTLAAMRFALERAKAKPDEVRRVIVVIPYLSIIEQNAKVYRNVFGDDAVLEHHSNAVYKLIHNPSADGFRPTREEEESRSIRHAPLETENWDAPIIVTTSVRFFESLFSNHPSDLRRVHNIARSVIILDEVQTFPRRLLAPLLGMLRDLTRDWGCTVLMSTATQPAFEARTPKQEQYAWPKGTVAPIIPQSVAEQMHAALRRVVIEWRLDAPTPWVQLASELSKVPQVLCVVNLRGHAAKLYEAMLEQAEKLEDRASIFHLSTRMCAQHRLDVLAEIRKALNAKPPRPCRIISTQLVEAGVDLSVPIAYRALGPLDAIVQVAGRVDREGKLTEANGYPSGKLIVFRSEDGRTPPHDYRHATGITEALSGRNPQTDDLDTMLRYFEQYYGAADAEARGEPLQRMRRDHQFAKLAEEFEYINSRTQDVLVPYKEGAALLDELRAKHFLDRELMHKLQRYNVGLYPHEFAEAHTNGIYELWPGSDIWVSSNAAYNQKQGLLPTIPANELILEK